MGIDQAGNAIINPLVGAAQFGADVSHSVFGTPATHGDWMQQTQQQFQQPELTPGTPTERMIAAGARGGGGNLLYSLAARSYTPVGAGVVSGLGSQYVREHAPQVNAVLPWGVTADQVAGGIDTVGGLVSAWPLFRPGVLSAWQKAPSYAQRFISGTSDVEQEARNVARIARMDFAGALGGAAESVAGFFGGSPSRFAAGLGSSLMKIAAWGLPAIGRMGNVTSPRLWGRLGAGYMIGNQLQDEGVTTPGSVNPAALQ
jgi:hypothetical protein